MDATTTLTLRCTVCGVLQEAKCSCGASYGYISPGELAAKAVENNTKMSSRAIAAKLGIDESTVRSVRKRSGAGNPAPRRVEGLDGKSYPAKKRGRPPKAPGVEQAQRSIDLLPEVWEQVKARAAAGNMAVAEFIGQLLTVTIDPTIDPKTLSKTGQDKLAAAIRQHRKVLEREMEQRVQVEYTARVKKTFPDLEKMERDARDEKRTYERLLRESKKLGTMSDWNNLVMCLHPDTRRGASDERFDRALAWVQARKFAITGEK